MRQVLTAQREFWILLLLISILVLLRADGMSPADHQQLMDALTVSSTALAVGSLVKFRPPDVK